MKFALYNKKRDFKKTREPKGIVKNKYHHLFVIQKHAASHLHYDFRLELNGVLLSWAVPKGPSLDPTVKRLAMHVEDHPVEYGNFEGIIPEGQYGAGTVMLWDKGIWIPEDENPLKAYRDGHLRFTIKAKKLKGRFSLIKFKSLKSSKDNAWFLIKSKDKYAKSKDEYDIILEKPNSVWRPPFPKGVKLQSAFPKIIFPELATLTDIPPNGENWLHEIKLDGYRILTFKKGKKIRLMSRNNKEWTKYFPNLHHALSQLSATNIILDGEVVLLDENHRSDFQLLQNSINSKEEKNFLYYIFDILYYEKFDLMSLTLLERKSLLQEILYEANQDCLIYNDHIIGSGAEIFKKACKMSLEGIVSKNIQSPYIEKRTKDWLKIKCVKRQEFVIGGFTRPQGARSHFGSLYLGYYENNKLIYCGNVGTGFNEKSLTQISKKLNPLIIKKNPFATKPPGRTGATWVSPKLVADIEFSEWTDDNILRQARFKGLLPIKITNPNKILYPEGKITKLDLMQYYDEIMDWILPFIVNRPLTILRCPDSYKECFFQKHINKSTPQHLYGISIKEKEKTEKTIYIKDREGLLSLVQMGTLEIHPWGSRIERVELPDMITIDLDPAPDIPWKKVVIAAKRIKETLDHLKLKSFVKTTGGKGLHVVIPIQPEYPWATMKKFAHALVQFMMENYPNEYVDVMTKIKRKGKIFVDYMRNQRGATSIAAYSTRAKPHAPVAVPLHWDELTSRKKDTDYTIKTLPERLNHLKKDPWKDFFKIRQSLNLDKLK